MGHQLLANPPWAAAFGGPTNQVLVPGKHLGPLQSNLRVRCVASGLGGWAGLATAGVGRTGPTCAAPCIPHRLGPKPYLPTLACQQNQHQPLPRPAPTSVWGGPLAKPLGVVGPGPPPLGGQPTLWHLGGAFGGVRGPPAAPRGPRAPKGLLCPQMAPTWVWGVPCPQNTCTGWPRALALYIWPIIGGGDHWGHCGAQP